MWMEESLGTRVNLERTRQLLETGASTVAVACPFCMTMIEDGVKDKNREEDVKVLDVAEVVAAALVQPEASQVDAADPSASSEAAPVSS